MRRKYSGRREQAVVDFRGQGRYKVDPQSGQMPALSIVPPHLFPYTQFRRRSLVSFFSSISGKVPIAAELNTPVIVFRSMSGQAPPPYH
jgi:hypothetical protein